MGSLKILSNLTTTFFFGGPSFKIKIFHSYIYCELLKGEKLLLHKISTSYIFKKYQIRFTNSCDYFPDNDVRINTKVNDIDMDNISRSKNGNVSVLQNKQLGDDKGDKGDDLVTWNSAAVQEDWWSVCQLPVFVVLFAVIGVLAITFVVSFYNLCKYYFIVNICNLS